MSDELRLPDDLAACEALLAAKPLAGTRIDRDELLYRAGWAAGAETARLATRRTAAWSVASAAVAASIAVAITLQVRPVGSAGASIAQSDALEPTPSSVARDAAVEFREDRPSAVDVEMLLANFASGDRQPLAVRRGMRTPAFAETQMVAAGDASLAPPAAAKTARELLEEVLPASGSGGNSRAFRVWPWNVFTRGEST